MSIEIIDSGSSNAIIRQLWISDNPFELEQRGKDMLSRYHPCGYGTMITEIKPCESVPQVKQYAGKYFCNFSRYTSCD